MVRSAFALFPIRAWKGSRQNSVQRVQEALVWDGAEAPLSLVWLQQSEPENNIAESWDNRKRPCGILSNVFNLKDTEATAPWKKPWHKSYHPQHQHQYCIFRTPWSLHNAALNPRVHNLFLALHVGHSPASKGVADNRPCIFTIEKYPL